MCWKEGTRSFRTGWKVSCCNLGNWLRGSTRMWLRRSRHKNVATCCWYCCSWSHGNKHPFTRYLCDPAIRRISSLEQVKVIKQSSNSASCSPFVGIRLQPYQKSTHWLVLILVALEKPHSWNTILSSRPPLSPQLRSWILRSAMCGMHWSLLSKIIWHAGGFSKRNRLTR